MGEGVAYLERIKRNERICAMIQMLSASPNHIITLSHFCEMFGAAKSTVSEDIDIAADVLQRYGLGTLQTVAGSAGGVRYLPLADDKRSLAEMETLCKELSLPERILPGGFLYVGDVFSNPAVVEGMGRILAGPHHENRPDFVLTVETQGVPVALMTARALAVPLVIARRNATHTDGSVVSINYVTGSTRTMATMSLSRRVVQSGQRALIIDDFMKGGGTARGMMDLMGEFNVEVMGMGVVIATAQPEAKLVQAYRPLLVLEAVDEARREVHMRPAQWLFG